jgi:hypothetical protein
MISIETIVKQLSNQNKARNTKGFVIDYTTPSVAGALAIYCASKTLKSCTVVVSEIAQLLVPIPNVSVLKIPTDKNVLFSTFKVASIAHEKDLLVIQPFNIVELDFLRPWPTRFNFIADSLPFEKLLRSEVNSLYASIADMESDVTKILFEIESREHYSSDIKASFDDIEWAFKLNRDQTRYQGIITNNADPAQHSMWPMLTSNQKRVISLLHQRHKTTNNRLLRI